MSMARWSARAAILTASLVGRVQQGRAQQDTTVSTSVQERIDRLDQQVRILQRQRELERDSIAAAAKDKSSLSATRDGFTLKSADGDFQLKLRGYVQADGRFFVNDPAKALTNTFVLRRVRPILEGTLWKYFDFRIMPDFGSGQTVLFDAYTEVRLDPTVAIRAGKFKPPVGLERLQSAVDIPFAERGLPTNLVPNRDVGLQVSGDITGGVVSYAAGVFNGVPDLGNGDTDLSEAKDVAARVFVAPFRNNKRSALNGLGFGIAGTTGRERGTLIATGLPSYRSPGQQTAFRYRSDGTLAGTVIANGTRSRIAPQASFYTGALGLQGEYVISRSAVTLNTTSAELEHHAWHVQGSYFLTGEKASFKSVLPKHAFDPKKGGAGAVEVVARYGELTPDADAFPTFASATSSVRKAKAWGVGANWHLARGIKLMVDYEQTKFQGGAAAGDRATERFLVARVQHAF